MTIAFGAIGARSTGGTTTTAVAYPASVGAGNMLVLANCGWPDTAGVNAISGWAVTQQAGGTGSAIDAHTTSMAAFVKEAAGGETGSVTVTRGGTPNGQTGRMVRYTKTAGAWETPVQVSGNDNTHGANRSITTAALDLAPGDMLVIAVATDTDTSLTITSPTLTATGITFDTVNRRSAAAAGVTTGQDGNLEIFDALVTAGSGSVAVTFAFTTATSQCGPVVITRLREAPLTYQFYTETSWSTVGSGTDPATYKEVTVAGAVGDRIVVCGLTANAPGSGAGALATQAGSTGSTGSWTILGSNNISATPGTTFGYADVTADGDIVIRCTVPTSSGGTIPLGVAVWVIPAGQWSGAPVFTAIGPHDADAGIIANPASSSWGFYGVADWGAEALGGIMFPGSANIRESTIVAGNYTPVIVDWADLPTGSTTFGPESPTGSDWAGGLILQANGGGAPAADFICGIPI